MSGVNRNDDDDDYESNLGSTQKTYRPYTIIMAPSTGFRALINTTIDVKLLCLQRLVRLYAFGISSLILALHLAKLGFSEERIGLFMTLTLLGDVFLSLVVTAIADRIGRARMLALGSLLMASSGVIFAISNNYWVLLLASIFGVISPRYVHLLTPFNSLSSQAY